MEVQSFHIHGDNIVECDRTLSLIARSLGGPMLDLAGPTGAASCPTYRIDATEGLFEFTCFPGFGRWHQDILQALRARGGCLRESADAIVTKVDGGSEDPVLAIEYCGALPAGNQAWQRSGRAYSYGRAGVPFIYIAEIGGSELAADRTAKAQRLPNAAVPFSYLAFSLQLDTPVLPVFMMGGGASSDSQTAFEDALADTDLPGLVHDLILGTDPRSHVTSLEKRVVDFVRLKAGMGRQGRSLTGPQWADLYEWLQSGGDLCHYLLTSCRLPWSKTAYIAGLTDTAKSLMKLSSDLSFGLTSSDLPMCVVPPESRRDLADKILTLYGTLPEDFENWLAGDVPLAICWLMGFKPRGDDARPDRGLPPLARMLIGDRAQLLTVVYGPAPAQTWGNLEADPGDLAKRNGLWEAIFEASDALLVDSSTDAAGMRGYLKGHWGNYSPSCEPMEGIVQPRASRVGEQDVDTVIHSLLGRLAGDQVFEGLCNPPGGDWSGISLENPTRQREVRWLSLPRVSSTNAKRPDHVFQIHGLVEKPVVLSVESKERAGALEDSIGPRLSDYMRYLLDYRPSVQRQVGTEAWQPCVTELSESDFVLASAVAFIGSAEEASAIEDRVCTDLILALEFSSEGAECSISARACSQLGARVADLLCGIPTQASHISVAAISS